MGQGERCRGLCGREGGILSPGMSELSESQKNPLGSLDEWEDFVQGQLYPEAGKTKKADYRNYDNPARDTVREFYRFNHQFQTYEFVQKKNEKYLLTL